MLLSSSSAVTINRNRSRQIITVKIPPNTAKCLSFISCRLSYGRLSSWLIGLWSFSVRSLSASDVDRLSCGISVAACECFFCCSCCRGFSDNLRPYLLLLCDRLFTLRLRLSLCSVTGRSLIFCSSLNLPPVELLSQVQALSLVAHAMGQLSFVADPLSLSLLIHSMLFCAYRYGLLFCFC